MSKAILTSALLGLILAPGAANAQSAATEQQDSVRRLIVFGNDPCPTSGDEIVVCARRPESERFRIPQGLRDEAQEPSPESESWGSRAESLEYVGNGGIQSCSTVGPGGQTGCWEQLMRQAREERRAAARAEARRP
jgi:hypothetical protein